VQSLAWAAEVSRTGVSGLSVESKTHFSLSQMRRGQWCAGIHKEMAPVSGELREPQQSLEVLKGSASLESHL